MSILWVIVYWLHLLATVTWIGGMIFYVLVLVPSMGAIDPPQRGKLVGSILKRYAPLAWGAIVVLIVTGVFIARRTGMLGFNFNTTRGIVLFAKHVIILIMVLIGAMVSLVIGPKLKAPPKVVEGGSDAPAGPSPQAVKLQKQAGTLGVLNLVLGIGVLFLTELMNLV
jgi:uncharacterized membrane protein